MDDHSRFCWLYMMKNKTEVSRILKNLCQLVRRQFEMNIQGFRTDNAKDFYNNELQEFFEQEGIRHETSCPYTPQQNGLAEKKIGDLMDKCRTLIEQAHLPKNLWGFAAMTAVYLINRLPTTVLHLKSPIDVLEEKFPKVRLRNGLKPRIFGCVSYVHTPHWSPDKLSAKALKCVFIGYSNTQKGYKCYHPLTRRVIISKDIVFDENRFYYQPNTEVNNEQDSMNREIPTPLPSLDISEREKVQPPQGIREDTMPFDSELPVEGDDQLSTYPKYYMRRKK